MKKILYFSPLIVLILSFSCGDPSGDKGIQIENSEFIKIFNCDRDNPGVIQPEFYRKKDGKIINQKGAPYFEFIINGKVTTSDDRLWVFRKMKERHMMNGGTEYTLEFAGVSKQV